jgi:hypothetical protein
MSTSALSKESLSYTYTTVPTYTNTMVGFSNSTTTLTTTNVNVASTNVLSISITNPGIYLCEGNIGFTLNPGNTLTISLNTTSATANNTNASAIDIGTGNSKFLGTRAVITISTASTLYFIVSAVNAQSSSITSGYLKYTRIA